MQPTRLFTLELSMLKFVILGVASLAFVGTAVAADLPPPRQLRLANIPSANIPSARAQWANTLLRPRPP
jgi:hypothetical protein